jgi:hypothetical protein
MVPHPYRFIGIYAALLRSPEQPAEDLWAEEHGREHVRVVQRGQV